VPPLVGFPVTLTLGFIVLMFAIPNLLPQMQHLMDGAFGAASSFGHGGR
jgi:flagellar biosynthesis protein FliR